MLATEGTYREAVAQTISAEALVIAYVSPKLMRGVYVKNDPEHVVQFTTGTYHTQDWIGKPFGSAVFPRKRRENVQPLFLLAPTPELWTRVLTHRTQILYLADISLICTFLELKPGSLVVESGTGSASLTHALARAVAPTGRVDTFEFHQDRCTAASEELQRHGLGEIVHVSQRDVQSTGFPEELRNRVDGVFLDLPEPWKAVASAVASLKPGRCVVTFSPCIEQIQRTCQALTQTEDVIDVRVMECIAEEYRVKGEPLATDLAAYHARKCAPSEPPSAAKRKATDPESAANGEAWVVNARMVALKGHTGFLVVGRRFASSTV